MLELFVSWLAIKSVLCSVLYFEKFLFIHRSITRTLNLSNIDLTKYTDYIEYFYFRQINYACPYIFHTEIPHLYLRLIIQTDLAKPSIDHIIPKSRGGTNDLNNIQFLTVFENLAKRDMTMQEWEEFKLKTNTHSQYFIEEIIKGGDVNE